MVACLDYQQKGDPVIKFYCCRFKNHLISIHLFAILLANVYPSCVLHLF